MRLPSSKLALTFSLEAVDRWPTLAEGERIHIEKTLERTRGNISAAAKLLSIERSSLQRKMRRLGLR